MGEGRDRGAEPDEDAGMTGAEVAPTVVVVGGGLAGITAALVAADAGAQVTLLEARARLGGATFSFQRDGLWIDNGQHVFLRCCTAYRWLLRRLGAEDLVTLQRRLALPVVAPGGRVGWLRRGALPLPPPLHLAGALARYPYLSWPQRLRVGRAALAMRRLDPADEANDRQALAPWLAAHGQDAGSLQALWELISLPTLNARAVDSSLALGLKVFKTGLLEAADSADIGYARVPLQQLHGERAEKALGDAGARLRTHCRVSKIEPLGGPEGGFAVMPGEGERLEAAAVILAVPHDGTGGLLPTAAEPDRLGALGALGSSPIVNLHVRYDRRVTTLDFAAGLRTPVQWVFDRTAASGLDPAWGDGQHLAVSLSAA
ncbi:MAG TPA: FAD-dependent oxidoreductase, partial [Actinomycetota bacterium]